MPPADLAGAAVGGLVQALPDAVALVVGALRGAGQPQLADQVVQILGPRSAIDAAAAEAEAAALAALSPGKVP